MLLKKRALDETESMHARETGYQINAWFLSEPTVFSASLGNVRAASQRDCELQVCESASCKSASLRVESLPVTSFERKNYMWQMQATHIYYE